MAKKSKKAKKASKSKKAVASGGRGAKTVKVPVQSVLHFMNMIRDQGHAEEFARAAKRSKLLLSVAPETVKFVRKFLTKNELHAPMAASVVDPCPDDPFDCKFRN